MGLARTLSLTVLSLVAGGMIATAAAADTPWQARHPRQEQVLTRDAHQRVAIRQERREGDLTRAQAKHLLAADRRIVRQDHVVARANGGFITKHEQRVMNHEEVKVDRRIPG
jgi:hypothetical protein